MTSADDMFDDMEKSRDETAALTGSARVDVRDWLGDLTYDEVHSWTVGFSLAFLAVFFSPFAITTLDGLLIGVSLFAGGVSKSPNRFERMRYVVREPHYYFGGVVLGVPPALVGWVL